MVHSIRIHKALPQMSGWFFPTATNTTLLTLRWLHRPKNYRWVLNFYSIFDFFVANFYDIYLKHCAFVRALRDCLRRGSQRCQRRWWLSHRLRVPLGRASATPPAWTNQTWQSSLPANRMSCTNRRAQSRWVSAHLSELLSGNKTDVSATLILAALQVSLFSVPQEPIFNMQTCAIWTQQDHMTLQEQALIY